MLLGLLKCVTSHQSHLSDTVLLYASFITSVTNRDINESGTKKQHHTFFEVVNERPQGDNYAGN
jgi:hypothetical protein